MFPPVTRRYFQFLYAHTHIHTHQLNIVTNIKIYEYIRRRVFFKTTFLSIDLNHLHHYHTKS